MRFRTRTGIVEAVRGISFSVGRERLGIVGESGSGKTMTGRAILRLIRPPGEIEARRIALDGADLLGLSERQMRKVRGERIAMVMQDPKFSLNPVMRIGRQLIEALQVHTRVSKADARRRALEMLEAVQIRDPERVLNAYPHEMSGGMGQRIMIAMMLIPGPDLLIADEPTSALDVTVQLQVLGIMDALVRERGMGLIFISHDLRLVATFCDRVLVMYAGRIVEELQASRLTDARHPYTRGLLNCLPRIGGGKAPLPVLDRRRGVERVSDGKARVDDLEVVFGYGARPRRRGPRRELRRRGGRVASASSASPGSGKSTVLRAICGLAPTTAGDIRIDGEPVRVPRGRAFARRVQMVFQDPYASLHPRHTVDQRARRAARHPRLRRPPGAHRAGAAGCRPRPATSASASRISFRAASASASPSPARSSWSRKSCSSTSPPPRSTPRCRPKCSTS